MFQALWIAIGVAVLMCMVLPSREGSHHFKSKGANVAMGLIVAFVVADVGYLVLTHQL